MNLFIFPIKNKTQRKIAVLYVQFLFWADRLYIRLMIFLNPTYGKKLVEVREKELMLAILKLKKAILSENKDEIT